MIGDIEYWKFDDELQSIQEVISSNPTIRNNSFNYWYTSFHDNCCSSKISIDNATFAQTGVSCTTGMLND